MPVLLQFWSRDSKTKKIADIPGIPGIEFPGLHIILQMWDGDGYPIFLKVIQHMKHSLPGFLNTAHQIGSLMYACVFQNCPKTKH
jgi:hypothetical protein